MADRPGGGRKGGGGGNKKRRRKAARGGEPSRSRSAQQPLPSQPPPSPLPVIVRAPLHALLQSLAKLIQQVRGKNTTTYCTQMLTLLLDGLSYPYIHYSTGFSRPFPLTLFHQEGPCQACDESAPLPPLPEFQKAAALVSETSTKLAALFSSPPTLPSPMNCTAAVCAVEQAAATLTATYHHISPIYGVSYFQLWRGKGFSTLHTIFTVFWSQFDYIYHKQ